MHGAKIKIVNAKQARLHNNFNPYPANVENKVSP